jgi:hypothetical protein
VIHRLNSEIEEVEMNHTDQINKVNNLNVQSDEEDEDEDINDINQINQINQNNNNHIGLVNLTEKKINEFKTILNSLSLKRFTIKKAMKFCYDNVQSAKQIINLIYESIINSKKYQEKVIKLL